MKSNFLCKILLRFLLNHKHPDEIIGDYDEIHHQILCRKGRFSAKIWYWRQVMFAVFPYIKNCLHSSLSVLFHSFKITRRQLNRNKGYSFINITGLAVGLACFLLVSLYWLYETSYDSFHDNSDRLFRIMKQQSQKPDYAAFTPLPMGPALKQGIPEAEIITRTQYAFGPIIKTDSENIETRGIFADRSFFEMFRFPLEKGDPTHSLSEPFSVILTPSLARKCFGTDDPNGKSLTIVVRGEENQYLITGILEHEPRHSHLSFNMLISSSTIDSIQNMKTWPVDWNFGICTTYIQLSEKNQAKAVEQTIFSLLSKHIPKEKQDILKGIRLQKITEIHLRPGFVNGAEFKSLQLLFALSLVILLVACINFVNLTTARSSHRLTEIGARKVMGAHRGQLLKQFLGESILLSFISLILAWFFVAVALPAFNSFMQREISLYPIEDVRLLVVTLGTTVLTGLIAGIYPAVFLSSFQPVTALKAGIPAKSGKGFFRNSLVTIQFAAAVFLIFATLVVLSQLSMMNSADLGWDKENLVEIWMDPGQMNAVDVIKNKLLQNPDILNVSLSGNTPYYMWNLKSVLYTAEDDRRIEIQAVSMQVGEGYPEVFGMEIVQGRSFSRERDESGSTLINQMLADKLGTDNPVGKILIHPDEGEKEIIGVIKDFHHASFHHEISPLMYTFNTTQLILFSRVRAGKLSQALPYIEDTLVPYSLHEPFQYSLVEDDYQSLYRKEQRLGKIFENFSILAVLLACLGLFGLAAFSIERRVKEIGIRKVLGARTRDLVMILSKEFLRMVLLANIIAWPLSFLCMSRWLQNYAFRIEISGWIFLISGGSAFMIAWLTVGFHTVKAALADPVKSLRYE